MASSGRLSATNTLRRSTRLISPAGAPAGRRQGSCDRAGQKRRIGMAEQPAAGDQQACGEQREAKRGIAEGQGADDDRAVLEHHQDADHRHEHVGPAEREAGPDRVAPGVVFACSARLAATMSNATGLSPLPGQSLPEQALRTEDQHHEQHREGDQVAHLVGAGMPMPSRNNAGPIDSTTPRNSPRSSPRECCRCRRAPPR